MTDLFVDDPDFRLYVGDVRTALSGLPTASVDCVVTSPPYWGLRDYGTGSWEDGDPGCDHEGDARYYTEQTAASSSAGAFSDPGQANIDRLKQGRWREHGRCVKCGAERVDDQIGLERTPAEYVEAIVGVFREVRRVLADHGTVWLNLGDSYASSSTYNTTQSLHTDNGWKQDGDHRPNVRASRPAGGLTGGTATVDVSLGAGAVSGLAAKNLVGIPWRVAFALQDDGWILRSEIVWAKGISFCDTYSGSVMPESVTDRPTKAHEQVFLLTKNPRYYYDANAVRENAKWERWGDQTNGKYEGSASTAGWVGPKSRQELQAQGDGRNLRSVWAINPGSYSEAHFATFPESLVRPMIQAGCPERVCVVCGKPSEREREREREYGNDNANDWAQRAANGAQTGGTGKNFREVQSERLIWTDCGHDSWRAGRVLDPFMGSGTTALVARKLARHAIGVELNPSYAALCASRLQQLSLFAGDAG